VLGGVSFADHIVVNNGVVAKEVVTGETVYASFFSMDDYGAVIGATKRLCPDMPVLVMVDEYPDYEYCADVVDAGDAARGANDYHMEYINWNPRMLRAVETLEALPTERVIQCCIMHEAERLRAVEGPLAEATRGLAHVFTVRNTKYRGSSLEVLPEGASKWRALQFLAASYSIPPQRIMAIGDDLNDLAMVQGAGFGVAMANAVEPVRRIADWVTADKDHDGVAEAIERYAF
jgi:hydroxymethylpyrimidine pyrophosphatase-like HAD family hydrolase